MNKDIENLVISSIEVVLMRAGGPYYHHVLAKLQSHDCKIFECFDHPEFLKSAMHQVFGNGYPQIIQKIIDELGDNMEQPKVRNFILALQVI